MQHCRLPPPLPLCCALSLRESHLDATTSPMHGPLAAALAQCAACSVRSLVAGHLSRWSPLAISDGARPALRSPQSPLFGTAVAIACVAVPFPFPNGQESADFEPCCIPQFSSFPFFCPSYLRVRLGRRRCSPNAPSPMVPVAATSGFRSILFARRMSRAIDKSRATHDCHGTPRGRPLARIPPLPTLAPPLFPPFLMFPATPRCSVCPRCTSVSNRASTCFALSQDSRPFQASLSLSPSYLTGGTPHTQDLLLPTSSTCLPYRVFFRFQELCCTLSTLFTAPRIFLPNCRFHLDPFSGLRPSPFAAPIVLLFFFLLARLPSLIFRVRPPDPWLRLQFPYPRHRASTVCRS